MADLLSKGDAKAVGNKAITAALDKTLEEFAKGMRGLVAEANTEAGKRMPEYESQSKEQLMSIYKQAKQMQMSGKPLSDGERVLVALVTDAEKRAAAGLGEAKGSNLSPQAIGMAKGPEGKAR